MSETETEIGRRIASGELASPQRIGNFYLFALRFSGTGTAWRAAHNEHVFRPPEQYLTPEMCARIAGVPVVSVHPKKSELDTKSYIETVVGAVCFGYVAGSDGILSSDGNELWCISRVNDDRAAAAMETGKFSTSPAVIFAADSGSEKLKLQDGTAVLFEGRPAVIDHLAAIIEEGVWDKGGAAGPGVRVDSTEGLKGMTTTTEQPAQDIKADEMIDKVLKHLDSKFDAVHKRMDAIEGKRNDAADPERDEWQREDAAACARDDATEERERKEMENLGEAKEVAADKARQARRDRVKARRDMARRNDSAAMTTAEAAADRERSALCADIQARADSIASAWGERAPAPMQGETPIGYRVRLLRHHQQHCTEPSFKTLDLGALAATHPTALDGIETRIYADSVAASANPVGPDDRMIQRTKIDPDSGHRITEFFGRHTFIHHLKRPSMRATAFLTPNNRAA